MILADLDFDLPPELIAQTPAKPRDSARLLCLTRADGALRDRCFADLPTVLRPSDVLIRNDTRVLPARTHFRRATGGRLEVLFLEPWSGPCGGEERGRQGEACGESAVVDALTGHVWHVLMRGRPRVNETLVNSDLGGGEWEVRVVEKLGDGRWLVENLAAAAVPDLLRRVGVMPLPPYIRTPLDDPERYQTIFAHQPGSAAAPTAGLHFTTEVDSRLAAAGVDVVAMTLHVGLGTFKPLSADMLADNHLHSEPYVVEASAWRRVLAAKAAGRRLVAVGTTMVRLLETLAGDPIVGLAAHAADTGNDEAAAAAVCDRLADSGLIRGRTDLFIQPGFDFRLVDGVITNFHLPGTSLLALAMAFAGVNEVRAAYAHAIATRYRFYSFGDAMLVL
ncbi:MAG: tRNA preQ1(34) S-adenosylmethionine ribosyltransferase-isomerase QueA [Thermoleophilia bacterium]